MLLASRLEHCLVMGRDMRGMDVEQEQPKYLESSSKCVARAGLSLATEFGSIDKSYVESALVEEGCTFLTK